MTEHWSLGYLIGLPAWIIVSTILGLAALAFLAFLDDFERWPLFFGAGALWALSFCVGLATLWPVTDADYHKYKPVSGVVDQMSTRLVASGDKSMEQKIVVTFKDREGEYGCKDTRCSLAKQGDHLDLSCIKVWEWAATDGSDCKFVRRQAA